MVTSLHIVTSLRIVTSLHIVTSLKLVCLLCLFFVYGLWIVKQILFGILNYFFFVRRSFICFSSDLRGEQMDKKKYVLYRDLFTITAKQKFCIAK